MKHAYWSLPGLTILCLAFFSSAFAQRPSLEDFMISGDTRPAGDQCFRLTEEYQWSSGSIWHRSAVDLSAPFSMELKLMFGCSDAAGADGMVFVFTPQRMRQGFQGEGMGFAGLRPSMGIEIDTWENEHLGDPPGDHVALLANGTVNHYDNISGPHTVSNLEDCKLHLVKIDWQPAAQRLQVNIDGRVVMSVRYDIIGKIFRGDPNVYWGVTAATGRYFNRQEICFEKLSFRTANLSPSFDPSFAKKLLGGDILPLPSIQYPSGGSDLQSSAFPDLDRLVNLMKKNPKLSVEIFGHTDDSGDAAANKTLSQRRADSVAGYLISKGIPASRIIARGFGEQYPLVPNNTTAGRNKNRRIEIHLFRPVP